MQTFGESGSKVVDLRKLAPLGRAVAGKVLQMQGVERECQSPGVSHPLDAHIARCSTDQVPNHTRSDVPARRQALDQRRTRVQDRTQFLPEAPRLCKNRCHQQAGKRLRGLQPILPLLSMCKVVVYSRVEASTSGRYLHRLWVHVSDEAPKRLIQGISQGRLGSPITSCGALCR